jgi:hypothetical protein
LFELYRALYTATAGAVSPLVGQRLENLGYDRAYSLRPQPTAVRIPSWEDALAWDGRSLTTLRPVLLDVGAAGKGYLVDLVAGILDDAGIPEYVVDASGSSTRATRARPSGSTACRTRRCAPPPRTAAPGATGCTTSSTPSPASPPPGCSPAGRLCRPGRPCRP